MCCAGIIHWKVFETYIGTEMKKRKSDVFAFIGFSFEQKNFFLRKHMDALCAAKGEGRGMREARKHVAWYMHGLRGAAEFRRMAGELETLSDLDKLLEKVYIENKDVSFDP